MGIKNLLSFILAILLFSSCGYKEEEAGNLVKKRETDTPTTPPVSDTTAPTLNSITISADNTYIIGQNIIVALTFSEAVKITGTPRIPVAIDASNKFLTYFSGNNSTTLVFRYAVVAGDLDTDGVGFSQVDLTSGTIKDAAGNNATNLSLAYPDSTGVLVDGIKPSIVMITPPIDATYVTGDNLEFDIEFDENVNVTGSPRIALTIGSSTKYATVIAGSGSTNLTARYTVVAGDYDINGITVVSPMQLNSGTINSASGNSATLTFTAPNTSAVLVDATPPTITSITPPSNATYVLGQDLDFTVNFSKDVTVTGTPRLAVVIGSTTVYADYNSGDGSNQLLFKYTVTSTDVDTNGIALTSPLSLNAGTIVDSASNNAVLTFTAPNTTAVLVDGVVPTITSVSMTNGYYKEAQNLNISVLFNENVVVTGTPKIQVDVGGSIVDANYISGSGTNTLIFRYVVAFGDNDLNGLDLTSPVDENGGTIQDTATNNAVLTFTSPNLAGVIVDTTAPTIASFTVPSDDTYILGETLDIVANFSEAVNVTGPATIPITIGSSTVYANYFSGNGTNTITFRYTVVENDLDADGIDLNTLVLTGASIDDLAYNTLTDLSTTYPSTSGILIDAVKAAITSITPPADATYYNAQNLDFTINFNKNVTYSGSPRLTLTVGSTTRYATIISGNGTNALVARHTVVANDTDSDGITMANAIALNSGSLNAQDGNDAILTFTLPNLSNILINGASATITSITPPTNDTYILGETLTFVANYSSTVDVTGTPQLDIVIGSTTVNADYVSGDGTNQLTFTYTIAANDSDTNGISLVSPINLNGGAIEYLGAPATLTFAAPNTSAVLVDGNVPVITATNLNNGYYKTGNNIDITTTFSENIVVTGTPRLAIDLNGSTVYADYLSGSNTNILTFRYTVIIGDNDSNGIALTSPLELNGGAIKDIAGNDATLTYTIPNTSSVIIDTLLPTISSFTIPANDTYIIGENLDVVVNFSEIVNVSGPANIPITIGASTVYANYLSGNGSAAITFRYTVVENDLDSDGIALSTLNLTGATINDLANNSLTDLSPSYPSTAGVLVDGVKAIISSVTAPANATYTSAQNLDFIINFNKNVSYTGSPRLTLTVGSTTRYATIISGSGTSALTARHTVVANDYDNDGLAIATSVDLNSGTLNAVDGNEAVLTFSAPDLSGVLINGISATISSITPPANDTYILGETMDFIVNYSLNVTVTGTPQLSFIIGSTTVAADYISGSGSNQLTFRYTVGATDVDTNGIALSSPLSLNGGTILDTVSGNANLTFTNPNTASVLVDGAAPVITTVALTNGYYKSGNFLNITATFSENVTVTGAPRIGIDIGGTALYADYISGSNTNTLTFRYTIIMGDNDSDGPTLSSPLDLNSGTIRDAAGNNANLTFTLPNTSSVIIDTLLPTISSFNVPADDTYILGENLDIIINFTEVVSLSGPGVIPITIGASTVYATYLSGNNSTALTFRYTAVENDLDTDGIVPDTISLTGASINDLANNSLVDLTPTYPSTSGVLVDAIKAAITSITPPTNATYNLGQNVDFLINFNKAVTYSGSPRLTLTVGATTRYAVITSGIGTSTVTARYAPGAPDSDTDGIVISSPVDLNSGSLAALDGNLAVLTFTVPDTTGILIDAVIPTILSVTAPADGYYKLAQDMDFTINTSENVVVTGTPRITLTIGSTTRYATYLSGSNSSTLVFRYTVQNTDEDTNGINMTSPMDLNTGSINDNANNPLNLTYTAPSTTGILVDGIVPTITSVTTVDGFYKEATTIDFTVVFAETVYVSGSPRISLTVGASTLYATYLSGSASNTFIFRYTVGSGENDVDGLTAASPIELNSGTIRDLALNDTTLTYSVPNTSAVIVDTTIPGSVTFASTSPVSPSQNATPSLIGTAEGYADLAFYADSLCSISKGTSSADSSGNFSYIVPTQTDNTTITYYATQTDRAGNISACSATGIQYEQYTIADGMLFIQGTRNVAGTNMSGVASPIQWSIGYEDQTYYSHSTTTNNHQVTILTAGDYLINVTSPTTGALTRGSTRIKVLKNGVFVPGAISQSDVRENSSSNSDGSNHLTFLLENLSVNDIITVTTERNTTAGTLLALGRATMQMEYIDPARKIFTATATQTTNSTNFNQATAYPLQWTHSKLNAAFTHNNGANTDQITVNEAGDYWIAVNVPLYSTATNANIRLNVRVNGVNAPGFVAAQGAFKSTSHDNSSLHFTGLLPNLNANDIISITVIREANTGTVTIGTNIASIYMEQLDTTSNIISLKATALSSGSTWNPTAATTIAWSAQDVIDSSIFTHSTVTNNHEITVNETGDYFIIYNDAVTTALARPNPVLSIRINGVAYPGATCATHMIRNSNSHSEASCSLSFYFRNLTAGDVISLSLMNETSITGAMSITDFAKLSIIYKQ